MHCTSPGSVPNKFQDFVQASVAIKSVDNDLKFLRRDDDDSASDEFEKQIYDDPCEIMDDWPSPVHIPRSRSWLCCPDTMSGQEQPEFHQHNLRDYQLITTEPKLHQSTESIDVNIEVVFFIIFITHQRISPRWSGYFRKLISL